MTTKNYKKLYAELAKIVKAEKDVKSKAELFADEHGLVFYKNNRTYYPDTEFENVDPDYSGIEDCDGDEDEIASSKAQYDEYKKGQWLSSTDECSLAW